MRPVFELLRARESWLFLSIGAAVAVVGHALLALLVDEGLAPAAANAVQLAVTLQLSFLAHDLLTWRRQTADRARGRARRWRRFQAARGASALLSLLVFPFLAPAVGTGPAYWGLLAAGTVVNYCSDRFWSFSAVAGTVAARPPARHHRPTPVGWRLARTVGAFAVLSLPAILFLDLFLVAVSLSVLVVAVTRLAVQLYHRWLTEQTDPDRYGEPDAPRLPGAIRVPMRHAETIAGHTLERPAHLSRPERGRLGARRWPGPVRQHRATHRRISSGDSPRNRPGSAAGRRPG